ncbi:LysR family transcriptional regulator [Marinobacterium arenosum]|uniref:LysR family transcriptional regulator n=1 Tax=Marinobacterium arenosum TaxID=2862496 RepID=UPI001C94A51E|nr:LysR family transcriptional regulator [Marinobacterium arenosum]MBY4676198.1 LysR family transcriptional regulator [Marinobacterium arenosum]
MDKLSLMQSFVAVVEQGSFTAAASQLGKTKAIVSRQVQQLEELLRQRLLNRTTRTLAVTDEGRACYERCKLILDEVTALEVGGQREDQLAGRLRITAPQTFGETRLMELLPAFIEQHPQLHLEMQLSDRYLDLVGEGFDIGLRIGTLTDSSLVARQIGSVRSVTVASPALLARYPKLSSPADLEQLPCIHDSNRRSGVRWTFTRNGETLAIRIQPRLTVNSALASTQAAIQGIGVALLPDFAVEQALQQRQLVALFSDYDSGQLDIQAVYPHRQHLAAKVRLFIDFLQSHWQDR